MPDSVSDLNSNHPENNPPKVRSLRELLDQVTGKTANPVSYDGDSGIAEGLHFPFLALVGENEMKLALLLSVINPAILGVLLIGPRGTGKTTAARSLQGILPQVEKSTCYYGCLPEDIESGGMDAVCPDCAKKYGLGLPLTQADQVRFVELPLNARMEDVVGGLDERNQVADRTRIKRGILSLADRNILYIDEVNLLSPEVANSTLDASAQGAFTVHRGAVYATYNARFTLIGSMNPEEGNLHPQILDRFGLRVMVKGLLDPKERYQAYQRALAFKQNPRSFIQQYAEATALARQEILNARKLLPQVILPERVAQAGIFLVQQLGIDTLRAELNLFEAARAYAASDNHCEVTPGDLRAVAPMVLRLRHSNFIKDYFSKQDNEDQQILSILS